MSETSQVRFWLCRLPPAKCPTFLCLSFLTGKMRMKIPHGVTMKIVSAECAQHLQRGACREGGISHCRLLLLLSWSQRVTSDGPHVSSTQLAAGHVQTTHRCDYIRNRITRDPATQNTTAGTKMHFSLFHEDRYTYKNGITLKINDHVVLSFHMTL